MQRLLLQRAASRAVPRLLAMQRVSQGAARSPCRAAANAANASAGAASAADAAAEDDAPTCVRARLAPVAGPLAEVLSDALLGFGANSVTVSELRRPGEPESPIYDAGGRGGDGSGGGGDYWPRCEVVAHFPLEADADAAIKNACAVASGVAGVLLSERRGAGAGGQGEEEGEAEGAGYRLPPPYLLAAVANREWVEQIKASYVPLDVVPGVVRIVPEGHEKAEQGQREEGEEGTKNSNNDDDKPRLRLTLRPGVAFGTGEHPTTRLCLRAVARLGGILPPADGGDSTNLLAGARILDYGTGSGVLAVAALLLGAKAAVGTDTDPLAVRASAANARLNGIGGGGGGGGAGGGEPRFAAVLVPPSLPSDDEGDDGVEARLLGGREAALLFDVVVANILRGPLIELAPRLARLCAPGGALLLSGVLATQAGDVRARYEALGFCDFSVETEGSWAALSAVKGRK